MIKTVSSLEKVFPDSFDKLKSRNAFSMLKNERLNFQIVILSDIDRELNIYCESDIPDLVKFYKVESVPVKRCCYDDSDDYYIRKEPGLFPDLLIPIGGRISVSANKAESVWVEVCGDSKTSGTKTLKFTSGEETAEVSVNIINALLPEQKLVYTNWYHADCLCDYYGVEAMSNDFWHINRNFIETAVNHGQNCILTPLFTPALDTAEGGERTTVQLVGVKRNGCKYEFDFSLLTKWINLCKECGIKYFEMSPLFTQWGAEHSPKVMATTENGEKERIFGWETPTASEEYYDFIRQLGAALCEYIDGNSLTEKVFFHISDEPGDDNLDTYKNHSALINEVFGKYKTMDALSSFEFYRNGAMDIPVPSEGHIDEFAGKVPCLWTYYCCGQHKEFLPNRFIAMPSLRNRILGLLGWKYGLSGFLQWGYNFYNSQLSLKRINPYETADADGAFPAGDPFVVYPAPGGEPYCSLRIKVFYDALQDMRALALLESLIGREKTGEIIGDINFKNYPHDDEYLLSAREKVNEIIASTI